MDFSYHNPNSPDSYPLPEPQAQPQKRQQPKWEQSLYKAAAFLDKLATAKVVFVTSLVAFVLALIVPFLGFVVGLFGILNGRTVLKSLNKAAGKKVASGQASPTGQGLAVAGTVISSIVTPLAFITFLVHSNPIFSLLALAVIVGAALLFVRLLGGPDMSPEHKARMQNLERQQEAQRVQKKYK
jgi:hypothetical protein